MRRRAGVGVGVVTSLALGWLSNPLSWTKLHAQAARERPTDARSVSERIAVIKPKSVEKPKTDSCTAYQPADPAGASGDETRGEALTVINHFLELSDDPAEAGSVRYVIALVPDPRHTRLSMFFDRSLSAIEDAAQDDGFQYDSSWLPWKVERHQYGSRDDVLHEEESQEARERCPGVLIFRKGTWLADQEHAANGGNPYKNALFVFVVAEQPTGGLN